MACANFRDTLLYRLWSHEGVQFEDDRCLNQALRFQEHQNGRLVSIKYLTDRIWSKKLQGTPGESSGPNSETYLDSMAGAVKEEFQAHPFLWQGNKSVPDSIFGGTGQRLPNMPHGLNDYTDYDRIAFLSALNPRSDHFRFLETRGIDPEAVRRAIYCSTVYQSVMRTSIRNPKSANEKVIIVPDITAARYLEEVFPGCRVEKLKTGLIELHKPKNSGRPRKYSSDSERKREFRLKTRKATIEAVLDLKKFPYVGQSSCDEEDTLMIGDKKGIDIITHFVPHHQQHGTLYRDRKSNAPSYLSGEDSEEFLGFLEHLHKITLDSKEKNCLISPGIF
jgi:hypothetical protein